MTDLPDEPNGKEPADPLARFNQPSTGGPSNRYDGLHTAPVENYKDINIAAIPPNGERPIETNPTKHLFGNFSD
jgi:hypothetical protein